MTKAIHKLISWRNESLLTRRWCLESHRESIYYDCDGLRLRMWDGQLSIHAELDCHAMMDDDGDLLLMTVNELIRSLEKEPSSPKDFA